MAQNTFWIAANILFDLGTGKKQEVLLLVNRVEDATVFTSVDAQNYLNFVKRRASNIIWSIEQLASVPRVVTNVTDPHLQRFIIKGVQYA